MKRATRVAFFQVKGKMAIHKFKYKDRYILLDINSSNVFEIDELVYDILDYYPQRNIFETVDALKDQYSETTIREVVEDIDELIGEGKLFSKETYINPEFVKSGSIKAMCLNIAHDCNLACKYCFASGGDFKIKRELMSLENAKAAMDFLIRESKGRKNLEVDFFGGEPLMNFEVVKQTVAYAREREKETGKNFRFTITTNALLLDDKKMEFINKEMVNLVLSLDGRKEVHDRMRPTLTNRGSYDIVCRNIANAVKLRGDKDYFVRGTYTSHNLDFADDVKHFADLGFPKLSVEPVVTESENDYAIREEHLDQIKAEYDRLTDIYLDYKKTDKAFSFFHFIVDLESTTCQYKKVSGCGAGCDYVSVAPDGKVYPCHQFVGIDEYELGTLKDGITRNEIRDEFRHANLLTKESCKDCWAKYFCGGGCHANSYNEHNDIMKVHELGCEMTKKRLECALYIKCVQKTLINA